MESEKFLFEITLRNKSFPDDEAGQNLHIFLIAKSWKDATSHIEENPAEFTPLQLAYFDIEVKMICREDAIVVI